jgi:putative ABC transport system permease protein
MFGIAIGIFAFTVMGSMSLKLNKMISGGKRYITGQISIMPKGSSYGMAGGSVLPIDTLNKIAKVEGVESVAAGVELLMEDIDPDDPSSAMSFGIPPTIEGMDLESNFKNKNWETMNMREGRMIEKNDPDDKIAVGITIATENNLKVSDKFTIRGKEFEVIGIIDRTMTGPDSYIMMSANPAREMLVESNPFLKSLKERSDEAAKISDSALAMMPEETKKQISEAKAFKLEDVNTMASASWKDGKNSEEVANRIKEQFKDEVMVLSPEKMGEMIDKGTLVFNAIVLGSALIALIVGGFSIINTMIMSISERTKEIGIKKSLGASNKSIMLEYTFEAGVIGLIGGLLGIGLGLITIILINSKTSANGAEIFLIDRNYLIGIIIFSFVLGILAGIIPAYRASRLKIVDAIREL